MTCGIYKIENKVNGKVYIGQSVNIELRWSGHRSIAAKSKQPLYRAMRKYGIENFEFSILEEIPPDLLTEREGFYMDEHRAAGELYNIAPAAGTTRGFRHSEETKALLSKQRIGIPLSEERRAKLSEAQRNSEATLAHCRKLAVAKVGVPHTPEHRAKIGAQSRGKVASDATRRKISAARTGRPLSPEHKAKISSGLIGNQHTKGAKLSDEHKAKVSASLVGNQRRKGIKHTPESRAAMVAGHARRKAALQAA